MAFDLLRAALQNWTTNLSVTSARLQRTGLLPSVTLLDGIMAWLFSNRDSPQSGWVGNGALCSATGLVVDVAPGLGFRYDSSASVGVWDPPAYMPIVLPSGAQVTLDAHSVLVRVDRIYATVALTEGESDTVRIRTAGPGSQASTTRNLRAAWVATIAKVTGTPGGSIPSLPAGAIAIAQIVVPATSGDVQIIDDRNLLDTSLHLPNIPDPGLFDDAASRPYAQPVVQSGIVPTGLSGLTYRLTEGYIDAFGRRRHSSDTRVFTHAAADATNPRLDLLYAYINRGAAPAYGIVTGTPAATPVAPTVADALAHFGGTDIRAIVPLWLVHVDVSEVTLSYPGDFTDVRPLAPITAAQIARKPLFIKATVGDEDGSSLRAVTLQLIDQDGTEVEERWSAIVRSYDITSGAAPSTTTRLQLASFTPASIAPSPSASSVDEVYSASSTEGLMEFDVTGSGAQTVLVEILPSFSFVNSGTSESNGARTIFSGHPLLLQLDFAA